eukprot:8425634-Heterocapsa_arctica.AAC.1
MQQRVGGHHGAGHPNYKKEKNMHERYDFKKSKGHRGKTREHLEFCTEQNYIQLGKLVVFMNDKHDNGKLETYYTLMEQKKNNTDKVQYGYIMFEAPVNKQYAGTQKEIVKPAEREGKNLKIKGDIVDNIMANGFSWQLKLRTANGRNFENEIENDKLSGRVSSVWNEHLFNEFALAVQPLIVVQGPCIRWPLR